MREFWLRQEDDSRTFIIEEGLGEITFDQIFVEADKFRPICTGAPIALVAETTWTFIAAYIALLTCRTPFLLLDPSLDSEQVRQMTSSLGISTIWRPVVGAELGTEPASMLNATTQTMAGLPTDSVYSELAMLMPTSGSTGSPKSVRVSRQNIQHSTASISRYLEMTPSRVLITSLPFHYTYGLSVLNLSLYARAKIVLTRRSVLSPEFWGLFADTRATDFSGVPFHFESFQRNGFPEAANHSLSCVTQAGGRLAPAITNRFLDFADAWGYKFFTMYGQTEATPRISYVPPSQALQKLGSVGVPIDIGRISVRDESGNLNPPSVVGQVFYEGPNVCLGYATSASDLRHGDSLSGELGTGDLGYLDEDGYLFLTGRTGREIKVSGHRVNLDELWNRLSEAGLKTAISGETDRIVVEVVGSAKKVRSSISSFSSIHPTHIEIHEVAELERLPNGKLDIVALKNRWKIGSVW